MKELKKHIELQQTALTFYCKIVPLQHFPIHCQLIIFQRSQFNKCIIVNFLLVNDEMNAIYSIQYFNVSKKVDDFLFCCRPRNIFRVDYIRWIAFGS